MEVFGGFEVDEGVIYYGDGFYVVGFDVFFDGV